MKFPYGYFFGIVKSHNSKKITMREFHPKKYFCGQKLKKIQKFRLISHMVIFLELVLKKYPYGISMQKHVFFENFDHQLGAETCAPVMFGGTPTTQWLRRHGQYGS